MEKFLYEQLSYETRGSFFEVYKSFGNAFKENVYHKSLIEEFDKRGFSIDSEKRINIYYNEKKVGVYVPDFIIENLIIVEIKCKPKLTQGDIKQFWQYLKGSEYKIGYLVNFGKPGGVEIIRRVYDTARSGSA